MNGYYDFQSGVFYDGAHLASLRRKFSRLAFAFLFYTFAAYVAIFLIQLILTLFGLAPVLDKSIYWQWIISLLPLYLFGAPCAYLLLKKLPCAPPKKNAISIGDFLLLFLIGRFFTLFGSLISGFLVSFTEFFKGGAVEDQTTQLISETPVWLVFIGAVIIGPIMEELVYRKWIIDRTAMHGETISILFSSLIFSLAHGNLYQVVYAFLNGCILGYLYIRTGRLRYSVIFHIITNFLGSIAVLPIIKAEEKLAAMASEGIFNGEYLSLSLLVQGYGYAQLILAGIGCALFFLFYKKYLPKKDIISPLPHGRAASVTLLNPGFLAFFFIICVEFFLSII